MDMTAHLSRLFSYDGWANREVVAGLRSANNPPARSIKLMAHIFAAERVWLERMEEKKQSVPVWPDFTLEQCEAQAAELPRLWKKYLEGRNAADLALTISYKKQQR